MNTQMTQEESPQSPTTVIDWKMFVRFSLAALMMPILLFLAAGRVDWWQAWVYTILVIGLSFGSRYIMFLFHPDLFAERARFIQSEGVKDWDKHIVLWISIILPNVFMLTAGLDKRFGWSAEMTIPVQLLALLVFLMGFALTTWAMIVNAFFSSVVRIQTERGQHVVTTGPYQFVRHPGYIGSMIAWLVSPIMLGSFWSFIPVGMLIVLYVIRTVLEDRTLQAELSGYKDYAEHVRYRLIPGLW